MNIEKGIALKKLQHVLFLYLKDIGSQLSGRKAGERYYNSSDALMKNSVYLILRIVVLVPDADMVL